MEDYEKLRILGKGGYACVYLVKAKVTGRHYAMKEIELDPKRQTRTKEHVLKEARLLAELRHPHIVQYHDSFFDPRDEFLCIVQDFCEGGTVDDRVQAAKQEGKLLPQKLILKWFIQILMAVQFIHSKKVLHRDLKTQNVFLMKNDVTKLGDFGIARVMENTIDMAQTCIGTPCYLSPEICQDLPYSSKSDIWAVGCMLYEMCAQGYAFDANNLISLYYKIVLADYQPISDEYEQPVHELLKMLLCKCPDDRPSAAAILNTPFIMSELQSFIQEYESLHDAINLRIQNKRLQIGNGVRPSSAVGFREQPLHDEGEPYSRSRSALGNTYEFQLIKENNGKKSMAPKGEGTRRHGRDQGKPLSEKDTGNYADDFEEYVEDSDYSDDFEEEEKDLEPVNDVSGEFDYPDDFEELTEEEEQELDNLLGNAKDVLEQKDQEECNDPFIEERDVDKKKSNRSYLRAQCRELLGNDVFVKILESCKYSPRGNHDDLRQEWENIAGIDQLETCFLVNELVTMEDDDL